MFEINKLTIPLSILFFVIAGFLSFINFDSSIKDFFTKNRPEKQQVQGTVETAPRLESNGGKEEEKGNYIKIADCKIAVETAKTDRERQIGLSNRNSLPENKGMLFIMPRPKIQTFWMLNMNFPLDFVWIRNNKVAALHKNIPAPAEGESGASITVSPNSPVDKVLEINAGKAEQCGIKVGDSVEIVLEE